MNDSKLFYPYPNKNSFLLGNWYWNNRAQKSRKDFKDLLRIISSPEFHPEDVRGIKWGTLNEILAGKILDNDGLGANQDREWMKEGVWRKSNIEISVPFHKRSKNPGAKVYAAGDFYHRSLILVIHEKVASVDDMRHFHLEPFDLFLAAYRH